VHVLGYDKWLRGCGDATARRATVVLIDLSKISLRSICATIDSVVTAAQETPFLERDGRNVCHVVTGEQIHA